jgi:hypothetical protein
MIKFTVMKYLLLLLLFFHLHSLAQPDPRPGYEKRIAEIGRQLKKNPRDYALIWERLDMKVSLLNGDRFYQPFDEYPEKPDCIKLDCKTFEKEFQQLYKKVIRVKDFSFMEAGDFFLTRMIFYGKTGQLDRAIEDAYHLRDSASYSKYHERDEYYNDWAWQSLFRLYVLKKNYDMALFIINKIIEKEKRSSPEKYYTHEGNYYHKVQLYEYFNKKAELLSYLKNLYRENFEFYFQEAGRKLTFSGTNAKREEAEHQQYLQNIKQKGFEYLKTLLPYLQKFEASDYTLFENIYLQLKTVNNEYYINPAPDDATLRKITGIY